MPHQPRRQAAPAEKSDNALDDEYKKVRGTLKRLSPKTMNLHDYEPDFGDVTRALFGRDMDVKPEPE